MNRKRRTTSSPTVVRPSTRRSAGHLIAHIEAIESRLLMSYTPAGADFVVNEVTAGGQGLGAIATDAAGNFVVTYQSSDATQSDIMARRFGATGNALGSEFRVNTTTYANQSNSSIAMNPAGDFVIVWMDNYNDTKTAYGYGIYGQRYSADGVPQGSEFLVNTTTAYGQMLPSVGMDDNGNFVVVWQSERQDVHSKPKGTSTGVYGQRFSAAGARIGGEFSVNTYKPDTQSYANIAMDGAGNFIVTWQSYMQDGSGHGVYAQRFGSTAQRVGGEFRVNDHVAGEQQAARIGLGPAGFTLLWRRGTETASEGVYAKRYRVDAAGAVTSEPERRVDASMPVGGLPGQVKYDTAGNTLITWSTHFDSTDSDSFAQEYDPSGNAVGTPFVLNSTTQGKQYGASVAFQPDGNFIAAFRGPDQSGSSDVFARRFIRDGVAATGTASTEPVFGETAIASDDSETTEPMTALVLG